MALTEIDYLAQAQDLLPFGPAWPREPEAFLTRLLTGLSIEAARVDARARQLLEEVDPRTSAELLADIERMLALPDDCQAGAVQQLQERRLLALQKLTARGGQSAAYFLAMAAAAGEQGAWIDEFRQPNCNSNCNAALNSAGDEFTWRMNFRRTLSDPRVATCNDSCNSALRYAKPSLAQCPITDRKPAHTKVLFAYAAISYKPADLQQFHTRASNAWAFDANGVLQQYAVDVLRIVPNTAGVLAALREPAATNGIRNSSMVGAVAGAPGVQPTNWANLFVGASSGVSGSIASVGTEGGLPYVDVRFQGVCSVTGTWGQYNFEVSSQYPAAVQGQTWTGSLFARVVAGAIGDAVVQARMFELDGANAPIVGASNDSATGFVPGAAALKDSRIVATRTFSQAAAARAGLALRFGGTNGTAYDFTLRIAAPQLEQQAFATTPVLTTGAVVTRAADVIQGPLAYLPGGAGVALKFQLLGPLTANATLVSLDDGTVGNRHAIFASQGSNRFSVYRNVATVETVPRLQLLPRDTSPHALAYRHKEGDSAAYMDGGGAELTPVSAGAPLPNLTTWRIGQQPGGEQAALYIQEFRLYRFAPSDSELKAATV